MDNRPGQERDAAGDVKKLASSTRPPTWGRRLLDLVKRAPGFVVGLATVISAAAAIAGLVASNSGSAPSPSRGATPPAVTTTSAPSRLAQSPKIFWGPGRLLISNNEDFDVNPPTTDNPGDVGFGLIGDNAEPGIGPGYGSKLAPWTGPGTPSPRQCLNDALTQSTQLAPIRDGSEFCVLTPQQRVAFVHVITYSSQDQDAQSITTVWTMPQR
jgi:hypothetical protein